MKFNKKFAKTAGIAAATAAVIFGGFIAICYVFVFKPAFERDDADESSLLHHYVTEERVQKNIEATKWIKEQNLELISITSFDGLKLTGYKFDAENAKGTFILMHGYHSEPFREYATLIRFYHDLGYNLVFPYQRTHGLSEGKYITFGVKERYDLRDWILEVNKIYGTDKPLFLQGISMGCATTVMCLGFDLPENVKGVVADCGFTSPADIIWKVLKKDRKLPLAGVIFKIGNCMTNLFADFDMNEFSTVTALKRNTIPVIFISGTEDDFVPVEMTIANFQCCKAPKRLLLVENCPHAIACAVDPEKYEKKVKDFLGL